MPSAIEVGVKRLWNDILRLEPGLLGEFSDDNYSFANDETALMTVLCWGPWREKRQGTLQARVLSRYGELGKPLENLDEEEIEHIASAYPLKWQRNALKSTWSYLNKQRILLPILRERLRNLSPQLAHSELQIVLGTRGDKIVDCLVRDWLHIDAFPIDSRAARVLDKYGIPASSMSIVDACYRLNIPVRPFARAMYYVYDRLHSIDD